MSGYPYTDEVISLSSDGVYTCEFTLLQPMSDMCAVQVNCSHIFVAGGRTVQGRTSQAYFYDQVNRIFVEDVPSMSASRIGIRCQTRTKVDGSGQEVIVVGGADRFTLKTTEIYDIDSNEWRTGPELQFPLSEKK